MVTTPRQILSPLAQYQAERLIERIGKHLEWEGEPIYLWETWSFLDTPEFASILFAAHNLCAKYRPATNYFDAPTIKALSDLLVAFFPEPIWHGFCDVEITEQRAEAWHVAQDIYLKRTGL